MELTLSRVDYLHVGSSFPNCIKILPTFSDDQIQQKVLSCFGCYQNYFIKAVQVQLYLTILLNHVPELN